jgi:hypothetical protein
MLAMLEHLRANSELLSGAKADGDTARVADNTRKLAELELAVRRIETLLKMGPPPGHTNPPVTPPGSGGGHNH